MLTAGRKAFIACVAFALASIILLVVAVKTGQLSDTNYKNYLDCLVWIVGIFCGGNGVEHVCKAMIPASAVTATDTTTDAPAVAPK